MFDLIYDYIKHSEFNKIYIKLKKHFFLFWTKLKLSKYILKCLTCQLIKLKNHKLYDYFNLISNFLKFFEIYILDFITDLSENNDFNVILIIMNKFMWVIKLISDKKNWNAEQWAIKFHKHVICSWNFSYVMILN